MTEAQKAKKGVFTTALAALKFATARGIDPAQIKRNGLHEFKIVRRPYVKPDYEPSCRRAEDGYVGA